MWQQGEQRVETPTIRAVRRRQILEVARAVVIEGGLGALTFGALERRVSFTRGVITHHFTNKRAIVQALLDEAVSEIDHATALQVLETGHAADRLLGALQAMVRGFVAHPEATRVLVSFWGGQGADVIAMEKNAALFSRFRAQCADILRLGQTRGEIRAELDADSTSAVVVGLVIGLVAQTLFEEEAIDVEAAVAAAAEGLILAAC